ncbi:hypothetical protein L204_104859 [Cryptococcus depauperatus]
MGLSLHNLLSSLRSPIFQTLSNPSSARMGTKYLRRRLRGPAVVSYYPQLTFPFPKLSKLNKNVPSNPFAGWDGKSLPTVLRNGKGRVVMENVEWKNEGAMFKASEVVEEGFKEVPRRKEEIRKGASQEGTRKEVSNEEKVETEQTLACFGAIVISDAFLFHVSQCQFSAQKYIFIPSLQQEQLIWELISHILFCRIPVFIVEAPSDVFNPHQPAI